MPGAIRVAVLGAHGRMGTETCAAVSSDPDLELVARVGRDDPLDILSGSEAEVAIDFTTPAAVRGNVRTCLERGVHAVVGTTGLSERDLEDIARWTEAGAANVLVAPNFAVGAVLMMRFAAQAAPLFGGAEIVERHHEGKLDAPSGTALRTAGLMSEARAGAPWSTPGGAATPAESRGANLDGIRVHSLRLSGSVAHQEVVLGSAGETLTIRHDALHRSCFMPGVTMAAKRIGSLRGLTVGLERLLAI